MTKSAIIISDVPWHSRIVHLNGQTALKRASNLHISLSYTCIDIISATRVLFYNILYIKNFLDDLFYSCEQRK